MKRSCLALVATFLVLTGGILAVQRLYPPVRASGAPPPRNSEIVGVISGLFLTLAVCGVFQGLLLRLRQLRLFEASVAGVPPADGAEVAAFGVLVADGPLLAAPLSGTPCVTYDYQISLHTSRGSSGGVILCSGHGLTPSHVETAAGGVRILACTGFNMPTTYLEGPAVVARATRYCAETTFAAFRLTSMRATLRNMKELRADDDGAIKADFGTPATGLDAAGHFFAEHVALDREEVCAFGRYSAERGGLVPDPDSIEEFPVMMWTGSASRIRRKMLLAATGALAGTLAMAAIGAGVLWAWYTLL